MEPEELAVLGHIVLDADLRVRTKAMALDLAAQGRLEGCPVRLELNERMDGSQYVAAPRCSTHGRRDVATAQYEKRFAPRASRRYPGRTIALGRQRDDEGYRNVARRPPRSLFIE
mmetsp:Transcript_11183/g.38510  ORF Transcript_11183/g.38510 Transcript_11183/m.38510 type:complete len:115 (-) Transcript_11183:1244-1588(-)